MRVALLAVAIGACGPGTIEGVDAPDAALPRSARTIDLQIAHGAFDPVGDHPNVVVHVPPDFDPAHLDVILYFHGWNNCATNVIEPTNGSCEPGGPVHNAYALARQLDDSGKNALLVVPELLIEQDDSSPGRMTDPGGAQALLDDTLAAIPEVVGARTSADIGELAVASHSGGYWAAAGVISVGGVPVKEVWLLDSLYGFFSDYDAWVQSAPAARFASLYTQTGGTLQNSQDMADRAIGWFADVEDDRVAGATVPDDELRHRAVFKYTTYVHDDVPRRYFEQLIRTSGL